MVKFTKHALEQIKERNLSEGFIEKALKNYHSKTQDEGMTVFHYLYEEDDKRYMLRIFVNEMVVPNKIVTVYKTSKIEKYQ